MHRNAYRVGVCWHACKLMKQNASKISVYLFLSLLYTRNINRSVFNEITFNEYSAQYSKRKLNNVNWKALLSLYLEHIKEHDALVHLRAGSNYHGSRFNFQDSTLSP